MFALTTHPPVSHNNMTPDTRDKTPDGIRELITMYEQQLRRMRNDGSRYSLPDHYKELTQSLDILRAQLSSKG